MGTPYVNLTITHPGVVPSLRPDGRDRGRLLPYLHTHGRHPAWRVQPRTTFPTREHVIMRNHPHRTIITALPFFRGTTAASAPSTWRFRGNPRLNGKASNTCIRIHTPTPRTRPNTSTPTYLSATRLHQPPHRRHLRVPVLLFALSPHPTRPGQPRRPGAP